jgi:hypothetical protein
MRATDHGYVAFVVDKDAVQERELSLGMSSKDGWVEVKSGLAAGDVLVVRGVEPLSKGAKIRIAKPGGSAWPGGSGAPSGAWSGGHRPHASNAPGDSAPPPPPDTPAPPPTHESAAPPGSHAAPGGSHSGGHRGGGGRRNKEGTP